MPPLWVIWAIVGLVFLVAEALTVGFFLGWFGIAAIVSAVLSAMGLHFLVQVVVFVALSLAGILISRRFAEKVTKEPPLKATIDRLIDQKGIVTETIDSLKGPGRVRVDHEIWMATAKDDKLIEQDSVIRVLEVSGTHLIVEPYEKNEEEKD